MAQVHFILNGSPVTAEIHEKETLLQYLRGTACLNGAKNGCGTGGCGACTVLVNGEPVRSCVTPLRQMEDKTVLTIEGLTPKEGLHPIQEAFVRTGAIQCGFCTPGMIMAVKALLDKHPDPTDADIDQGLSHNVCRCTGYVKIIDAVRLAAKLLSGAALPLSPAGSGLGHSVPDIDGVQKATGTLPFACDLELPGMVYGKVLWAAHPHAKILNINTASAECAPGVLRVLTARDVPGRNGFGSLKPDQPVLCADTVRFLGDAVALVVASSEDEAAAAAKLVEVSYEPLPVVSDMAEALAENAPLLHPDGNVCKHLVHEVGDLEGAKKQAFVHVSGHFETPAVEHAYLEPEAGVATFDEDGMLTLYAPTQFPFETKRQLVEVLGLPPEKVRVVLTPLGGGFGSKCDATIEFLLAVAAYNLRRPVKITLSRRESLQVSTKRHPYRMDYEVGATREGELVYVDAKLLSDAGPYTNLSPRVIDQACIFSCGPYRVKNLRLEGWAVHTNNANASAFRGFGINQAAFSIESLLDEIAEKLNMDRFDIRYRNALVAGDETVSGEILRASVGIKETIRLCKEATEKAAAEYAARYPQGTKRFGVGVASGFKNVGAGKGKVDDAGAILHLEPDGSVLIRVSAVDMGQGIRTTMAQITSETLGLPIDRLHIITGDTLLTPKHGGAVGERQTLISGNAMLLASRLFLTKLYEAAASCWGCVADGMKLTDGTLVTAAGDRLGTLAELAELLHKTGAPDVTAEYNYVAPRTFALADVESRRTVPREEYRNYPAYAYTTQAALVEVDTETGKVRVLKVVAAHDVGRIINPVKIEGQIEGSCSMGQGYALSEEYVVERGIHRTTTYQSLGVPGIADTPDYEILLVEDPEPAGPYGAKGISEVATVPITPAIVNAIHDAVGVRVKTLPARPEKLLKLMQER